MTKQELDRLITRTDLSPVSKKALRTVRKAVMSGTVGNPEIGYSTWSVGIQTEGGYPARMTFSFKRGSSLRDESTSLARSAEHRG